MKRFERLHDHHDRAKDTHRELHFIELRRDRRQFFTEQQKSETIVNNLEQ